MLDDSGEFFLDLFSSRLRGSKSGEPGSFDLRLKDALGADASNFLGQTRQITLSSCTFSQLLMAALQDSLFRLRFRRRILRCLWALKKRVSQN